MFKPSPELKRVLVFGGARETCTPLTGYSPCPALLLYALRCGGSRERCQRGKKQRATRRSHAEANGSSFVLGEFVFELITSTRIIPEELSPDPSFYTQESTHRASQR